MVDHSGLEPETDRLWVDCSNLWANGPGSCDRVWTYNQSDMNRTLYQLSYTAEMVELKRIELSTSCLQSTCSTNWAITPRLVGMTGFEPVAFCSQSRRDTKLRYIPVGALDRSWTHNLLVRSQILYPIELLALFGASYWIWTNDHCFANNCLTTWLRMH